MGLRHKRISNNMIEENKTLCHCCGQADYCTYFTTDAVYECNFCTKLIVRFGLHAAKSKAKRLKSKAQLRQENHQSQQQETR